MLNAAPDRTKEDLTFTLVRAEPLLVLVADGISEDPARLAWEVIELLASASAEMRPSPTRLRCRWSSPLHGELVVDRDPHRPHLAVVRAGDFSRYASGHRLVSRTVALRAPEVRP